VLPAKFPNLVCNGSSGIAVGMATNIPPHNLGETVDALAYLIDNPECEIRDLLKFIKGPDFPTGGIIFNLAGMREGYLTGHGRFMIRAKANTETTKAGKETIIVSEIPYQVNKSNLLEKIAELVRDKKMTGISDLRDESDRDGMRIVIELKRDAQTDVVLNQLFKMTQMQVAFGMNMLALVDGIPRVLNIKDMLQNFINHRHEVIVRRTKFELNEAEKRAHILEGYKIALDNIDAIIALIKKSASPADAKEGLMKNFRLSDIQAQAILEMRLQRLTGLERKKIEDEYEAIIKLIAELKGILESKAKRMYIIKTELLEMKEKYGDDRRTIVLEEDITEDFSIEDLIAEEDMVVTISHAGYIKRLSISQYRKQARGTRGAKGIETKDEDFAEHMFVASTHQYILFFTERGKCHWLKVHEVPQGGKLAKGKPVVNMIGIDKDDKVTAFVQVRSFEDNAFVVMTTKTGQIKKTELSAFANPRRDGIIAMTIPDDDQVVEVGLTDGSCDIVMATRLGQAIRFPEDKVRSMGRAAYGVRGITLDKDDYVIGMVVIKREGTLLTVTEHGYGKRSAIADYRVTNRGGKGVINIKTSDRNGAVVAVKEVVDNDELLLITQQGIVNRISVEQIRSIGRNTQGVRLIHLEKSDRLVDVARFAEGKEEGNGQNGNGNGNGHDAEPIAEQPDLPLEESGEPPDDDGEEKE
jgi:DNA gyrase subunit A